jgi:hypothetical protein
MRAGERERATESGRRGERATGERATVSDFRT